MANTYGAFTSLDYATATSIIKAADRNIKQFPDENVIWADYFKTKDFNSSGDTMFMFRNQTATDFLGTTGYVSEGGGPVSIKEKLTTYSITLNPKVYYCADVTLEAITNDPLPDTLARNLAEARKHLVQKMNYEMTNTLIADILDNSNTPQVGDGSYWYNSSDAGDNLPMNYGAHDFSSAHTVTFYYDASHTTSLDGHIETTTLNMTLSLEHISAIKEHLMHHGYGKAKGGINLICNYGLARQMLLLGSENMSSGVIPQKMWETSFSAGTPVGMVLGMTIIVNEFMPAKLALFVDNSVKPATRIFSNRPGVVNVSANRNLVIGTGLYYRAGYGIDDRGAGYIGYFDIA